MARKQPNRSVAKWKNGVLGASEAMREGAMAMTVNPMDEAIKAKDLMRVNILRAIDDGSWERGLRKRTKDQWQARYIAKGIPNFQNAVATAEPAMLAAQQRQFAHWGSWETLKQSVPAGQPDRGERLLILAHRHAKELKKKMTT